MNDAASTEVESILDKAMATEMISVEQLKRIVRALPHAQVVLLDVRTGEEHDEGVIPGSTLYPCDHDLIDRENTAPFTADFDNKFDPTQFDADTRYILICRTGPRTEIALERFLDAELQACELIGGVNAWREQGLCLAPPFSAQQMLESPDSVDHCLSA
ncbi:rhodanese-like domain-containing protein [Magnetofaba australis]|uniref:Putative rhodanese n=1 Tax=Magnetofaba australis IT-1 TaxID=1434232 RepID=A0A1Y2K284_9PROT|nr:rhodanese-like domain-containing protein [Magnetofaba australis]OSM02151.1 putative rhodanese [Magnetofaba australis IT-1]